MQKPDVTGIPYSKKCGVIYRWKIKRGTPCWLDDDQLKQIRDIYKERKHRNKIQGLTNKSHPDFWNVDHIVPLMHPLVCGLHVPWNLQLMRRCENASKSNCYWPHAPVQQLDLFNDENSTGYATPNKPHQLALPVL